MNRKFNFVIILLLMLTKSLYAQSDDDKIEVTGIEGVKLFTPHQFTLQGAFEGAEMAYHLNTTNYNVYYIKALGISSIDFVASYRNFDRIIINNDPALKGSLGSAYSIFTQLEANLASFGNVKLLLTPGFGLTWSTTSYFSNGNQLVGSHINSAVQLGGKVVVPISQSTALQAGVDIFHYSDAGARVPNNGINTFNISLGVVQNINNHALHTPEHPFMYQNKNSFEFGFDVGKRGVYKSKKNLYRAGLYAGYSYLLSPIISLKAGFDAGYYFKPYNGTDDTYEALGTSYDSWRYGISAGLDINLGRVSITGCYGHYLHFNSYNPIANYWAPGLKLHLNSWLALQGKMYVHQSVADYLGVGAIVRLH
jgi:hypothetical protein